jgi:hypothetical protein
MYRGGAPFRARGCGGNGRLWRKLFACAAMHNAGRGIAVFTISRAVGYPTHCLIVRPLSRVCSLPVRKHARWSRESRAVACIPRPRLCVVREVCATTQARRKALGSLLPLQRLSFHMFPMILGDDAHRCDFVRTPCRISCAYVAHEGDGGSN